MQTKTMKRYYRLHKRKPTKANKRRKYALYEKAMQELRLYLYSLTSFAAIAGRHEIQDELLHVIKLMEQPDRILPDSHQGISTGKQRNGTVK